MFFPYELKWYCDKCRKVTTQGGRSEPPKKCAHCEKEEAHVDVWDTAAVLSDTIDYYIEFERERRHSHELDGYAERLG